MSPIYNNAIIVSRWAASVRHSVLLLALAGLIVVGFTHRVVADTLAPDAGQVEAEHNTPEAVDEGFTGAELAAVEQQNLEEQLRAVRALRQQLDDLGSQLGAYDPALIEVQRDLGQAYLSAGMIDEAITVLGQALQLARVTDGLYNERQLPVLTQLAQAHFIKRDWEQVDDYQHLIFMLQSRFHEPDSAEYTDALLALGDWRLQALRSNLVGRPGGHQNLQMLQQLQDQSQDAMEFARAREDLRQQWALLYTRAMTDVEITRQFNYQSMTEGFTAAPRYITQTVCRTVSTGSGGAQRVCWQETVSNPDYYNSATNQRRMHLERARLRLQTTLREMDTLLTENPEFAAEYEDMTRAGRDNIQRVVSDLQRDARRASMRY